MLYGQTPKWIDRLERLLPGLGIPNLAFYLIGAQALGFLLASFDQRMLELLTLIPPLVLKGEVWRLVTFLALPISMSPLWMVFVLYFLYFIVNGIEEEWGEFRTTLYVLMAVLLTIAFSFIFQMPIVSIAHLESTLFLAAATIAPEYQILLFLVIPVKMKWLAWLTAVYLVWALTVGTWLSRLYLLAMYANYALFFGPYFLGQLKAFYRRQKFKHDAQVGQSNREEPNE